MSGSAVHRPTLLTACLGRLSEMGRPGRVLSPEVDRLRGGPAAVRLWREEAAAASSWGPEVRRNVYQRIWGDAAERLGADLEPLGGDFLSLRRGANRTIVYYHEVMLDNAVHILLALNKGIVQQLLTEAGLPVPSYVEVEASDTRAALAFMAEIDGPCVVKPANGGRGGRGVTCGVDTVERFHRARVWARRWDRRLLVEQQSLGEEYRFLFLDSQLLDILRRRPPRIVADGRSKVVELMARENNRRRIERDGRSGMSDFGVDLDCLLTLERAGLSLRSVPPTGTMVPISSTANQSGAADTETVSPAEVADELVEEARTAVAAIGLRLGSVEVITPDPTRSLRAAGGAILEVNGTPGLHYHYLVSDLPRATRVAVPILATLLDLDPPRGWEHEEARTRVTGIGVGRQR